jgi:hypothetical protein
LKALPKLRMVSVGRTKVTDDGLKELRKSIPNLGWSR